MPPQSPGVQLFHAANGREWSAQPLQRPLSGTWGHNTREDVVVCRSSTDSFEVQCHGGDAAVSRILNELAANGCSIVTAQMQAGTGVNREVRECLQQALTWRTANVLLEQASGVLQTAFEEMATIEWSAAGRAVAINRVTALLKWSRFGIHLSRPWSVVLTGRPNVGKSSLANALLGYRRAIVADEPGTTRDVVTGLTAFDGWPVELADTAGLRTTTAELEAAGISLARQQLERADCRLLLLDISEPPTGEDLALLDEWPDALIVAHKSDLPDTWGDRLPAGALCVSSRTKAGLDALIAKLVRTLVPEFPPPGTAVAVTERQILLLDQILQALKDSREDQFRKCAARLLTA